jgi:subtilase family serine protease
MFYPSVRSVAVGTALLGAAGLFAAPVNASTFHIEAGRPAAGFSALSRSVNPANDAATGQLNRARMSVEVALAPRNESQLQDMLANVHNPNSPLYGHWLNKGQFNSFFAPSSAQINAIAGYLRANGLVVETSSSPFFVRASGSSSAIAATFRTNLRTYRNRRGVAHFSNASAVQLPSSLSAGVLGVVGLTDTVRPHSQVRVGVRPQSHASIRPQQTSLTSTCEAPHPTAAQLMVAARDATA